MEDAKEACNRMFAVASLGALCAGCVAPAAQDRRASPLVNGVIDRHEVVYRLCFGLTDKDTGRRELTIDEAKDLAITLFIEAGSGYAVYEAEGGYAEEDGTVARNDTLVFDGAHGDEQAMVELLEKAKEVLNIESVYCESREVGYQIRGGMMSGVE